ncbi:transcriptional repressor NrdR [Limnobacter thiooxidans]|uniref:Transcriptional repressor NrdR n=1 Tax=Limnobacter thiooxidans TaxID=131080 RepID=A0AA86IXQ8_9BURK|nr:transcriptional repressor NrdR [Limnobacter thiooxidans]BET25187.1 transcriptional regulator NrdR [Limnobacter thiooxidans]
MKCPFCSNADTQVVDSRTSEEGDAIRRRRQCGSCGKRFTTYERAELFLPAIVKKDGSRVDYSKDKLRGSLMLALRKRPVPAEAIDEALSSIEEKLLISAVREVSTKFLGELVMQQLKQLDTVAYIRFASVYKSFEDLQSFSEEIAHLTAPAENAKGHTKPKASTAKKGA